MGIVTKTVIECTCDLCGAKCGEGDGKISIQVHSGDGRDVGPGFIYAHLTVDLPYRCHKGIVCNPCALKWLGVYVKNQAAA